MPHQGPRPRALPVLLTGLLLLGSLLASLPLADATFRTYGTLVNETDGDKDASGVLLLTLGAATLMFNDADGSAGYNCPTTTTCDPVYLNADGAGATVAAGDVRLSHATLTEGKQVKIGDTDLGNPLLAIAGGFSFIDVFPAAGVDGAMNLGEALLVDLTAPIGSVSAGDVLITRASTSATTAGTAAFTMIAAGSTAPAIGTAVTALGGFQIAVFDSNGDGLYNVGDGVVLDANADNLLNPGDTRLTAIGSLLGGTQPKLGDAYNVHNLLALPGGSDFAWADDGGGTVGTAEPVYYDIGGGGTVTANDVRIGPVSGGVPTSSNGGKQVLAADADAVAATVLTVGAGTLRFVDNNANGALDGKDDLYLDVTALSITVVEAGDLRLSRGSGSNTGGSPGTRVAAGNSDIGHALVTPGAAPTISFLDFDGGGTYALNDILYVDNDANGIVTPGDIRLSIGPSPASTFAQYITDSSSDGDLCYRFTFGAATTGWLDEGNPAAPDLTEGIYLDRAADGITPLDVRLGPGSGYSSGSFVRTGDRDNNGVLSAFAAAIPLMFQDSNGDGVYSIGRNGGTVGTTIDDSVYLDVVAGAASVAVGDVRVTKAATGSGVAGSRVLGNGADLSLPLGAMPAAMTIRGIDVNGDGNFGLEDALYVNVDDAAEAGLGMPFCGTPGDVRISGTGGTSSSGGGSGGGSGSPPAPPPSPGSTSTAPTIVINQPIDGSTVVTHNQITISGTATGGTTSGTGDAVSSITLSVNGQDLTPTGLATWSATFTPATDGVYTITATVTSATGATTTATSTFNSNASGTPPASEADVLQLQLTQILAQNNNLSQAISTSLAQNRVLSGQLTELGAQLAGQRANLTTLSTDLTKLQEENAKLRQDLAARNAQAPTAGGNGLPGFEAPLVALAALGAAVLAVRRRSP